MEKYVVKEISKNFKLHEKIIVKIFEKLFWKVYNITRIKIINEFIKEDYPKITRIKIN